MSSPLGAVPVSPICAASSDFLAWPGGRQPSFFFSSPGGHQPVAGAPELAVAPEVVPDPFAVAPALG